MKFYVISIILTVAVLFVPVVQKAVAGTEDNTIAVSLESIETMPEDGDSSSMEPAGGDGGSGGSPRTEEKQVNKEQNESIKNIQTEKSVNNVKTVSSNDKSTNVTKISDDSESNSQIKTKGNNDNNIIGNGPDRDTGNENGPGKGKPGNGPDKELGNPPKAETKQVKYDCVKDRDYKILSNPQIKSTRATQEMAGTKVNVKLSFNADGSVHILSANGGGSEAQKLAKKAAGGIRVKILNKSVLKCIVNSPYTIN